MMVKIRIITLLVSLVILLAITDAFYVSYEDATDYFEGDSIRLVANKLTSPITLSSIDYSNFAICNDEGIRIKEDSKWNKAVTSLHGDAFRQTFIELPIGQDIFCGNLCDMDLTNNNNEWNDAIEKDYAYHWWLDNLPTGYKFEDDYTISTRYWGGVPIGRMGGGEDANPRYNGTLETDTYIFNHWNFYIYYRKSSNGAYNIIRTVIEPFSIRHNTYAPIGSCVEGSKQHTRYSMLSDVPVQPIEGIARFTYDIKWIQTTTESYRNRWNIFLTMDGTVPGWIQFLGFFLGCFILISLLGSLMTWVLRDLSYKPIINESSDVTEEYQINEIQMWPLSTRIFFPPIHAPVLLCIACGTGGQLLASGFIFVILFRIGVISQTQGSGLVTVGAILYALFSPIGGYISGRLYSIFHGELIISLAASLATAITYPLIGILVVALVYDVFPDSDSPVYDAISNSPPLILLWIFFIWPATVAGGYFGHRSGPIQNFPVSAGSSGYQDLNLQDESDSKRDRIKLGKIKTFLRRYRVPILLLSGGFLPVFASFVGFSYGVAAPMLKSTYSERSYMIASFGLFVLVSCAVSLILYYKQIRSQEYHWWWASFAASGSAGIYIFLLLLCYTIFRGESQLSASTVFQYIFWFAFLSFGVMLMTGFAGVAACMFFTKTLYTVIMRRN